MATYEFIVREGARDRVLPFPSSHFSIGSMADCELRFDAKLVRPRHAEVFFEGGRWFIRDIAGSDNVLVNGLRTLEGPIADGALIKVGLIELAVCVSTSDGPSAGASGPVWEGDEGSELPLSGLLRPGQINEAAFDETRISRPAPPIAEEVRPAGPAPRSGPDATMLASALWPEPPALGDEPPEATTDVNARTLRAVGPAPQLSLRTEVVLPSARTDSAAWAEPTTAPSTPGVPPPSRAPLAATALAPVLGSANQPARRRTTGGFQGLRAEPPEDVTREVPPPRKNDFATGRRSRASLIATGVVVVLAGAAVAGWAWLRHRPQPGVTVTTRPLDAPTAGAADAGAGAQGSTPGERNRDP